MAVDREDLTMEFDALDAAGALQQVPADLIPRLAALAEEEPFAAETLGPGAVLF